MVDESVLPEDVGTGAPYGDFDDAANLASMIHRPNNVDFVVSGLELQPDFVQEKCYLTAGRAIVGDTEAQATESDELREYGVAYSAIMKARTSDFETNNDVLELAADTMNYVHVAVQLNQGDSPFIYIDQDDSGPDHPSFKIGEIDTEAEIATQMGRQPVANYRGYRENVAVSDVNGETLIDLNFANTFHHTLIGDVVYVFDGYTENPPGNSFTLVVEQDTDGGYEISWPENVEWDSGNEPNLITDPEVKNVLSFFTIDGGVSWIGMFSIGDVK